MNWSGEQYKCRKCGEVYPYKLSTCSCGGVCDKISDASQESSSGLSYNISVLADILEAEKQKEQQSKQKEREKCEKELAQLFSSVKDACSKNEYVIAISYLEDILRIVPDSMDAKKLLDFCTDKVEQKHREDEAKKRELSMPGAKAGDRKTISVNGVEFAFRWCPPGTFMMGSPESEDGRFDDETQHQVTLTKGFWMLETEVTQKQWIAVMGEKPRYFKGDDFPVYCVLWNECQDFCKKCTQLGLPVQLPTEAQWEYACRAGSTTAYFWGNALNGDKANCDGRYPCGMRTKGIYVKKPTPVGSYAPNAWGLYDMHGNVSEWCADWYAKDYPSGSVTDPVGPSGGSLRVVRGGSCIISARECRSARRGSCHSQSATGDLGFRVLRGL